MTFHLPLAAGLAQALGAAAGIIQAISMVTCFAMLVGATISAMSDRHTGAIKVYLIIAAVAALAWIIVTSFFTAGGVNVNITPTGIN
jgi:hypothetical protein